MSVLLISFCLRFGRTVRAARKIDEAFSVLGVVRAHGELARSGNEQREGENALCPHQRPLPEFQADSTGDALLGDVENPSRFTQRCDHKRSNSSA